MRQINETDIYYAYQLLFGREPDFEGSEHWLTQAIKHGWPPTILTRRLLQSAEYQKCRASEWQQVEIMGTKVFCDPWDTAMGIHLLAGTPWEPWIRDRLLDILRPGDIFLDIGASIGIHGLLAARKVGPQGKVIMIEPSARNCQAIRKGIAANNFSNCILYPFAAWNEPAGLTFIPSDLVGRCETPRLDIEEIVMGMPLDAVIGRADVIKMDIEGAEPAAFMGAKQILAGKPRAIFIEVNPSQLELLSHSTPQQLLGLFCDLYHVEILENTTGVKTKALSVANACDFMARRPPAIYDVLLTPLEV